MSIAKMMKSEFDLEKYSLSGIGGVETGGDAAEFILVGANTVQVGKEYFHCVLFIMFLLSHLIHIYLINISYLFNHKDWYYGYGLDILSHAVVYI